MVKERYQKYEECDDELEIPQEGDKKGGIACPCCLCIIPVIYGWSNLIMEEVRGLPHRWRSGSVKEGIPYAGDDDGGSGVLVRK